MTDIYGGIPMKKLIAALLIVCLLLSVSGCSMIAFIVGENAETEKYLKLTTDELAALSDEELLTTLHKRTEYAANTQWNLGEGVAKLPEAQRVFYVLYCFQQDNANGGLCRFFVNNSRNPAPKVSDALGILGAEEHKALFDSFVTKNEIDVTYLIYFIISNESEFAEQRNRYPFDDFDIPYGELPSLKDMLVVYAREHIAEF